METAMKYCEYLIWPTVMTGLLYLITNRQGTANHKNKYLFYISFFLFIFLAKAILFNPLSALTPPEMKLQEIHYLKNIDMLTQKQEQEFRKKRDNHKKEGQKYFNLAQQKCCLIPDLTDQEKAALCFEYAVDICLASVSWHLAVLACVDVLKEKWLDEALAEGKKIDFVFDDRPKVIRMWRRRGIFVFNCYQHDKEF